jgi:hypothetical protein
MPDQDYIVGWGLLSHYGSKEMEDDLRMKCGVPPNVKNAWIGEVIKCFENGKSYKTIAYYYCREERPNNIDIWRMIEENRLNKGDMHIKLVNQN